MFRSSLHLELNCDSKKVMVLSNIIGSKMIIFRCMSLHLVSSLQ